MLPDELQHQKLIEVGIQQGSRYRVEFPVVVVCPLSEIDDHRAMFSLGSVDLWRLYSQAKTLFD